MENCKCKNRRKSRNESGGIDGYQSHFGKFMELSIGLYSARQSTGDNIFTSQLKNSSNKKKDNLLNNSQTCVTKGLKKSIKKKEKS